jgi:hypothetical protein
MLFVFTAFSLFASLLFSSPNYGFILTVFAELYFRRFHTNEFISLSPASPFKRLCELSFSRLCERKRSNPEILF